MYKYITEIGLSGWLTAILLGAIFTIVLNRSAEKRELKSAKSALKFELMQNLDYLAYIYWENDNSGKIPRDIHYSNINLYSNYAGIILKNYPKIGSTLVHLFSAFDEIIRTKRIISTTEDAHDFLSAAKQINKALKLGLDNTQIEKMLDRDYSIR